MEDKTKKTENIKALNTLVKVFEDSSEGIIDFEKSKEHLNKLNSIYNDENAKDIKEVTLENTKENNENLIELKENNFLKKIIAFFRNIFK